MKSFFTIALIGAVASASVFSSKGGHKLSTKVVQPAKTANAASKAAGLSLDGKSSTKWDAWGRDQDLAIDESYGKTNAKSYRAESYDEWDNQDDDKWGGQGWGSDYDESARSSKVYDASKGEKGGKGDVGVASWDGAA